MNSVTKQTLKDRYPQKKSLIARDAMIFPPAPVSSNGDARPEARPEIFLAADDLAAECQGEFDMKMALDKSASVVESVHELAI